MLHAAAWTDVDGAEDDPQGAAAVNVGGTAHAASLGAPLVLFSTDYVFDGAKREPYVESDAPNPLSAYGRTKLHGEAAAGEEAWIVRTSGLFGWTSHNFVRTMLRLGAERDEVSVVADQRTAPTYVGHLAAELPQVLELPFGIYHVAASGDCTWAEFARGDLRRGGPVLPRARDRELGVGRTGETARVLGPAQREGRHAAPAGLARGPASLPGSALKKL